jgi:glycosyltransferase involved in cell wall biosynthesis
MGFSSSASPKGEYFAWQLWQKQKISKFTQHLLLMKILFIHHGDHRAGAPLSMLYTMNELRKRGFNPVVGLSVLTPEIKALYHNNRYETIDMPWIRMVYFWSANPMQWWKVGTYFVLARALYKYSKRWYLTQKVVDEHNIDIVHLNSVSLFMLVPYLLKRKIHFVWHIREHGPKPGSLILKKITSLMNRTEHLIFLSEAEKTSWLGKRNHGTVVYNFVDQEKFDPSMNVEDLKRQLNISPQDRVILYLGGLKSHKGVDILVEALKQLKIQYPNIKCIMPDAVPYTGGKLNWRLTAARKLKGRSFEDSIIKKINQYGLQHVCIRFPFDSDAQKYYRLAELVVFPALVPHFARPAIEAAIMKKPVIVSDWPVLLEIVKPNITGLAVTPNDVNDLVVKISMLLSNEELKNKLGTSAYEFAISVFTAGAQIDKIIKMYSVNQSKTKMA